MSSFIKNKESKFTYFIQSELGGLIKIGSTSNPHKRFKSIRSHNPTPILVLCLIKADLEKELHERFESDRVHHEWFKPSAILEYIKNVHNKGNTLSESMYDPAQIIINKIQKGNDYVNFSDLKEFIREYQEGE